MHFSLKIISHNYDIYLQLYIDNIWERTIQFPKSDNFEVVELSRDIPENSSQLSFRLNPVGNKSDAVFYLKYISLIIQ